MKARLKFTVLIFLVTVRFTEELTWNTERRATVCCQGKTQLLIWNFIKGENERITELHWFFNEKTLVCLESETTGFLVSDLYAGRVERNGTAGILLKNVCLNDSGEYTLYAKLEEERERNVQGINLTVVEPPPNQCKPIIKKEHPKGILYCSTSCERSPLSLEWTINGTKDPGDSGPYFVVNSSGTSEQPTCCLRDFKCFDDYQTKFCTQNNISFTEDMHTVNESVADTNPMVYKLGLKILIVTHVVLSTVVIACFILNIRRCRQFFAVHKCHYSTTQDIEGDQHGGPLLEKPSFILERVQELNADLRLDQIQDEASPMLPTDQEPHADVNDVQVPEKTFPILDADDQQVQLQENVSAIMEILEGLEAKVQLFREQAKTLNMFSKDQEPHADDNDVQVPEKPSSILGTLQDLDAGLRHNQRQEKTFPILDADDQQIQLQVPVESKSSNTGLECNKDLQQALTVAANTVAVEPKHSITVAQCNEDLQQVPTVAPTAESREMRSQLHSKTDWRRKENLHKYPIEMKQEECSDFNSKPLVHHGRFEDAVSG